MKTERWVGKMLNVVSRGGFGGSIQYFRKKNMESSMFGVRINEVDTYYSHHINLVKTLFRSWDNAFFSDWRSHSEVGQYSTLKANHAIRVKIGFRNCNMFHLKWATRKNIKLGGNNCHIWIFKIILKNVKWNIFSITQAIILVLI